MSDQGDPQAPAGWYPDPTVPGQRRYWDGTAWTEHTAAGAGAPPTAGSAGPAPRDASTGQGPDTWLWQSIVATVLCCLPAGIVGIVHAAQAQGAVGAGDHALAREKAAKARTWTLVSVALGVAVLVIWLLAVLVLGVDPAFA